ncbi:endonuclease [Acetobacter aceti 1023]|nr:endonuclease [Acetobacter aceti 1023]
MRQRVLQVCCGVVAFMVHATAWAQENSACQAFGPDNRLPVITRPFMLKQTELLCNTGYAVLVSSITHTPLWAAEHLQADTVRLAERLMRAGSFYEDSRWPGGSGDQDYKKSGYSRGHMAPSADQPTPAAQFETFAYSNMVPQTLALNQGIWARIEYTVRELAVREGDLYVVTGPAFHGHPISTIGPHHIFVPSSTWKAVYSVQCQAAGVYVCKNVQHAPHCDQVTVATLIRNTGVDPFPAVADKIKQSFWRLPSPRKIRR